MACADSRACRKSGPTSSRGTGARATALPTTSKMFGQYGKTQSPLDDLAVVLDGKVISFPRIQGAIEGGQAQITGNFDQNSATSLANVLSYGALPLSFHQQSVESVTPQLGHDQLTAGLIAAGLGLLLVVLYLLFYYRGLAIVAVSSLIIAALLSYLSVIALGKYQHYALSLAGIAGLIVAIGITADSFVVFFERLRDEVREGGKSLRTAVEHGWARARRTGSSPDSGWPPPKNLVLASSVMTGWVNVKTTITSIIVVRPSVNAKPRTSPIEK